VVNYKIVFKKSAAKELDKLPRKELKIVTNKIRALGEEPRPPGCEKLSGQERYRIRQGDYRVIYSIDDLVRIVAVVKIGHRRDVYR
jgi:mRNA interferase RelE/StbE